MRCRRHVVVLAFLIAGLFPLVGCAQTSRVGTTVEAAADRLAQRVTGLFEPRQHRFDRWLEELIDGTPDQRRRAVSHLDRKWRWSDEETRGKFGDLLARRLRDEPDELVRATIAMALKRYPSPETRAALGAALSDAHALVRIEAARSLAGTHDPDAVALLLRTLQDDPHPQVRAAAAGALYNARTRNVLLALIEALDDRDFAVVQNSVDALVRLSGEHLGYARADWEAWLDRTPDPFAAAEGA